MASRVQSTSSKKCPLCRGSQEETRVLLRKHKLCNNCLQQLIASGTTIGEAGTGCLSCGTHSRLSRGGATQPPVPTGSSTAQADVQTRIDQFSKALIQTSDSVGVKLGKKTLEIALDNSSRVRGIVVKEKWLYIIHEGHKNIWVYNSGKHFKEASIPYVRNPQGMVLINPTDVIVVLLDQFNDRGRLHYVKITAEQKPIHLKTKHISLLNPSSISFSAKTGELIIGASSPEFVICSFDGDVQKRIALESPEKLKIYPKCVAKVQNGYAALMSDSGRGTIRLIDEEGKQMTSADCENEEQVYCGPHIISDSKSRVIAINSETILVFDTRGHASQILLTGLFQPHFLHIHENILYIAYGRRDSYCSSLISYEYFSE